jgi:predicted Zn-dependent protease
MTRNLTKFAMIAIISCLLIAACATVPVTGRRQLNFIPVSTLNSMSFTEYSQFISAHKISGNAQQTALIKEVGQRIQSGVEQYLASKNMSHQLDGYKWEFNLVDDSTVNAWCMPGGKVVVYTGIMPLTRDASGLAVVMGHEIAHAVAQHGDERMSQGLLASVGEVALAKALENKPEQTRSLFMGAYGIGAQVGVLLPFSRLQESEADHLGLIFMAMAGYNPHVALEFWQRMADHFKGQKPPEFLSTHPSDETRIKKIGELIPEAMTYYKPR